MIRFEAVDGNHRAETRTLCKLTRAHTHTLTHARTLHHAFDTRALPGCRSYSTGITPTHVPVRVTEKRSIPQPVCWVTPGVWYNFSFLPCKLPCFLSLDLRCHRIAGALHFPRPNRSLFTEQHCNTLSISFTSKKPGATLPTQLVDIFLLGRRVVPRYFLFTSLYQKRITRRRRLL